jgi:hypothetical protein
LPALEAVRAIGGLLGLRPFTVTVRRRVWRGKRVGEGPYTDRDTILTNTAADGTTVPVRVKQISRRDMVASMGRYADRDLRVGPLTPSYMASIFNPAGGFDDATLNPSPAGPSSVEIFWRVTTNDGGTHGIPPGGAWFDLVGEEATALHYFCVLRANGKQP